MGEVYLALQERPNRPVALKILRARPGHDRDLLDRFRAEADAAARLRHPNIVQVYEAGESTEAAFIAMELVEGGSLAVRLSGAVLAPREAAELLSKLARAVHFAHVNGIIHRDLKPSNVLLDRDGTPKLSDFGLAKVLAGVEGDQTRTGAILGTPAYMAPEQIADGKMVAPATDIYGLGAILYECLTGRPPFKGATPLDTLEQVRTRDPILPGRLQPGIQRDIQTICLKCLAKSPMGRYQSALALAEDLNRFLRGEPIKARPVGVVTRAWKWTRRQPTIAALLFTSGLLAAGLVVLIVTYTARLRTEVDRANANAIEIRLQKDRTSTNYHSARVALALMIRRLDERRADDIPKLREVRRDQLEDALAFYEKVLIETNDADPVVQLDTARAAAEAGEIQFLLGREGAAGETFRKAVALYEGLQGELRTCYDCRSGLIHCYNHLAALAKGQPDKAERYLLKAHAEAEELTRSDPSDLSRLNALARVEHNIGVYFGEIGQHNRSEEHYLRAIEICTGLIARHPDIETYRAGLSESLLNLGLMYIGSKQFDKAADAFRRSDDLLRPLFDAHPGDDRYSLSLAALCTNWGNLLVRTGLPGALEKLDQAVELADAEVVREPRYIVARDRSLQAHGSRALAKGMAGQLDGALSDWDRVVELADDSARHLHRVNRAILLSQTGRYLRANAEVHELVVDPQITDYSRYNIAAILARSAKPMKEALCLGPLASVAAAEAQAATALGLLHRLNASGYFRNPDNYKLLTEDPDFDPIRSRTGFKSLLENTVKP
jgi:tetratricopeptide (TPR) repeat protein